MPKSKDAIKMEIQVHDSVLQKQVADPITSTIDPKDLMKSKGFYDVVLPEHHESIWRQSVYLPESMEPGAISLKVLNPDEKLYIGSIIAKAPSTGKEVIFPASTTVFQKQASKLSKYMFLSFSKLI